MLFLPPPPYDSPNYRPVRRPVIHPYLRVMSSALWTLDDRYETQANDQKRALPLPFGTTTAKPTWGHRRYGRCLTFDGGDTCIGTISTISAFPFWIAGSGVFDGDTTEPFVALSATGDAGTPAFMLRHIISQANLSTTIQIAVGGVTASFSGPAFVAGKLYHFALITRTRTAHVLFVNGERFADTTDVGATFAGFTKVGIGNLPRTTPVNLLTGAVYWGAYGNKDPGDIFLRDLTLNPWKYLYAPEPAMWLNRAAPTFNPAWARINTVLMPGRAG